MKRLRVWWHNYRQTQATLESRMSRIEASVERLAQQLNVHALATDTRLSIYDVLIPKTLADLAKSIQELAITQQRLVDAIEGRGGLGEVIPETAHPVMVHRERSA